MNKKQLVKFSSITHDKHLNIRYGYVEIALPFSSRADDRKRVTLIGMRKMLAKATLTADKHRNAM